jgi:hypothetical protein
MLLTRRMEASVKPAGGEEAHPSTVVRLRHSGPSGKESCEAAVTFDKAQKSSLQDSQVAHKCTSCTLWCFPLNRAAIAHNVPEPLLVATSPSELLDIQGTVARQGGAKLLPIRQEQQEINRRTSNSSVPSDASGEFIRERAEKGGRSVDLRSRRTAKAALSSASTTKSLVLLGRWPNGDSEDSNALKQLLLLPSSSCSSGRNCTIPPLLVRNALASPAVHVPSPSDGAVPGNLKDHTGYTSVATLGSRLLPVLPAEPHAPGAKNLRFYVREEHLLVHRSQGSCLLGMEMQQEKPTSISGPQKPAAQTAVQWPAEGADGHSRLKQTQAAQTGAVDPQRGAIGSEAQLKGAAHLRGPDVQPLDYGCRQRQPAAIMSDEVRGPKNSELALTGAGDAETGLEPVDGPTSASTNSALAAHVSLGSPTFIEKPLHAVSKAVDVSAKHDDLTVRAQLQASYSAGKAMQHFSACRKKAVLEQAQCLQKRPSGSTVSGRMPSEAGSCVKRASTAELQVAVTEDVGRGTTGTHRMVLAEVAENFISGFSAGEVLPQNMSEKVGTRHVEGPKPSIRTASPAATTSTHRGSLHMSTPAGCAGAILLPDLWLAERPAAAAADGEDSTAEGQLEETESPTAVAANGESNCADWQAETAVANAVLHEGQRHSSPVMEQQGTATDGGRSMLKMHITQLKKPLHRPPSWLRVLRETSDSLKGMDKGESPAVGNQRSVLLSGRGRTLQMSSRWHSERTARQVQQPFAIAPEALQAGEGSSKSVKDPPRWPAAATASSGSVTSGFLTAQLDEGTERGPAAAPLEAGTGAVSAFAATLSTAGSSVSGEEDASIFLPTLIPFQMNAATNRTS